VGISVSVMQPVATSKLNRRDASFGWLLATVVVRVQSNGELQRVAYEFSKVLETLLHPLSLGLSWRERRSSF
jgi:hypothetical protein